jgi:hypothetical protein
MNYCFVFISEGVSQAILAWFPFHPPLVLFLLVGVLRKIVWLGARRVKQFEQ